MNELVEKLRDIKKAYPEKYQSLLENMINRAAVGKILGITPEMIKQADDILTEEDQEFVNCIPKDTMLLFLEASELVDSYFKVKEQDENYEEITDYFLYEALKKQEEKSTSKYSGVLLEEILGESNETI